MDDKEKITYSDLFWLFIAASWFGVIIEGLYCLLKFGKWESHVVSIYGHFCVIYGVGVVFYYVFCNIFKKKNIFFQFVVYAFLGTFVELVAGIILDYVLGMRAWSYANSFLNYRGYICLFMFIIWGIFGILFEQFIPLIRKGLTITKNKMFKLILPIFTVFMIFNLTFTSICIYRWSERHKNIKPSNKLEKYIDKKYDDEYMSKRFMEWYFIDK